MKSLFLSVLFLLGSCSSRKDADPTAYLKLHESHKKQHKACIQHRDAVLMKPITESENADLDDEQYYFVRNEQSALKYIDAFDITKFTLKENQLEYEAIVRSCVQEKDPGHQTCDTLYPAFKFFRGLIHAMNQYGWAESTKKKGVGITLQYVRYVAESESSLMDILFANDLLTRLIVRRYVNTDILSVTYDLRREVEKTYRDLMKDLRKIGKRDLTCREANEFYSNERVKVKALSQRLISLLNRTKS